MHISINSVVLLKEILFSNFEELFYINLYTEEV